MPPARAISHSPLRMFWQARWTATKEDEQAVSSAMLGPCSPKTNDRRLAARQSDVPAAAWASVCAASVESMIPYSLTEMPTKAPVFVPRSDEGGSPASSSASQLNSSSRRCCGSIRTASRSEMPKKWLSNPSIRSRYPPQREHILPGRGRVGVVEAVDVPAVGRRFANGIHAGAKQLPVGPRIDDPAGKTAGHAHDRDRLGAFALQRFQPGLGLLEREHRALQRRQVLQAFCQSVHRGDS